MRLALAVLAALAACGGDSGPGGVVTVLVAYPGATPAVVEREVLEPVEEALSRVGGVYGLRGRASEGVARLDITFRRDEDRAGARTAVRDAVAAIQAKLPAEVEPPVISAKPAAWVMARIPDQPRAFDVLFAQLGKLPVTWIEQCGVREARLALDLVPAKLRQHGLTTDDVVRAVSIPGSMMSYEAIADISVGTAGAKVRDLAVITQRSQATCLVEGVFDPATPALLRVGLRHSKDKNVVVKALKKARVTLLPDAMTTSRPGHPTQVQLVTAPIGPVIEAVVVGDDAEALAEKGQNALATLRTVTSVAAAWCQGCERKTSETFRIDRNRATDAGVDAAQIAQALRAVMRGAQVASYEDHGQSIGVVLGVEEGATRWRDIPVRSADGTLVYLGRLVEAQTVTEPVDVLHVDRRRAVAVRLRGTPKTSLAELRKLATSALPEATVRTLDPLSVDAEPW